MELFSESTDEYSSNIPPFPRNERVFFTHNLPSRCSGVISILNPETQEASVYELSTDKKYF